MRLTRAIVVILDVSGYTAFIRYRAVTLEHAEQIISALLEEVIDRAEHPLQLNKLEGDAVLMWAPIADDSDGGDEATTILAHLRHAFEGFAQRLERMSVERSHCGCDACANIGGLELKAVLHEGQIAIKQIRQFEELAGEPLIAAHRLLKNDIPVRQYVLATQAFSTLAADALPKGTALQIPAEGLEAVVASWFPADPAHMQELPRLA